MNPGKTLLFLLSCLLLGSCASDADKPKHLLLICMDTVRADTFFELGQVQADALTPLLKTSLNFSQAHTTAPWTVPSIASVLTGLSTPQHGAGTFAGLYGLLMKQPPGKLRPNVKLLPEVLQENGGFSTANITSSAWTSSLGKNLGITRGVDEIESFHLTGVEADWRPLVDTWRELFLDHSSDSRAFHFLHLMEAHEWHMAPAKDLNAKLDSMTDEERATYIAVAPPGLCDDDMAPMCRMFQVYASAVQSQRDAIAAVLDILQQESLLDDTIVVVFSDHGEEFHDHANDGRDLSFTNPLTHYFGHGRTLYQEQLHVPLLIWSPHVAGATIDAPVSLLDIAPSVSNWLGIEFEPEGWEGHYLEDYLSDPDAHADRVIYATGVSNGPQQLSARQGKDKSIWNLVTDHTRYFDLETDPLEKHSTSSDQLVMTFDGLFVDFIESIPKATIEPGVLSDEETRRLQSIGYLQGVDVDE